MVRHTAAHFWNVTAPAFPFEAGAFRFLLERLLRFESDAPGVPSGGGPPANLLERGHYCTGPMKRNTNGPAWRVARLYTQGKLPLVIRGREFGLRDLRVILSCAAKYRLRGRTFISQEICRQLDWRQPNGWLNERACRDVLRVLHRRRLVRLPRSLVGHRRPPKRHALLHHQRLQHIDLKTPVRVQPKVLRLQFAKGNSAESVWNYLVDRYHYLAYKASVGRSLKYLVWADDRLVGAISFCSPVWRLKPRDAVLSKLGVPVGELHERVINNNRFLILPNVQVAHLASRVLAQATEAAFKDWSWYYGIVPLVAETFVAPSPLSQGFVFSL